MSPYPAVYLSMHIDQPSPSPSMHSTRVTPASHHCLKHVFFLSLSSLAYGVELNILLGVWSLWNHVGWLFIALHDAHGKGCEKYGASPAYPLVISVLPTISRPVGSFRCSIIHLKAVIRRPQLFQVPTHIISRLLHTIIAWQTSTLMQYICKFGNVWMHVNWYSALLWNINMYVWLNLHWPRRSIRLWRAAVQTKGSVEVGLLNDFSQLLDPAPLGLTQGCLNHNLIIGDGGTASPHCKFAVVSFNALCHTQVGRLRKMTKWRWDNVKGLLDRLCLTIACHSLTKSLFL